MSVLSHKKIPGSGAFTKEFQQAFKKEISLILQKLFQQIKEEETLPNLFSEFRITLLAKSERERSQENKSTDPVSFICIDVKYNKQGIRKLGNTDEGLNNMIKWDHCHHVKEDHWHHGFRK